jgi:L-cysteine S-thiosulfotransferase
MIVRTSIVVALACALLAGCGPQSGVGFRLPDGSPERGRAAFLALRCTACHRVVGLDAPNQGTGMANVTLGGETVRVKNYGELVTAIINPSHRIAPGYPLSQVTTPDGQSLMTLAYLNDVMTVQQLIDLVAFLQASYQVMPPLVSPYSYVYP